MAKSSNDKKQASPAEKFLNGNGHMNESEQLAARLEELQKANEEIRRSKRAALNLMEDAIASKEALRKSEEKYRSLFESIDEGVCIQELIYDDDGKLVNVRIVEANPAYEKQTGLKKNTILGELHSELGHVMENHWFEIYDRIAKTGKGESTESWHESTDRWYHAYLSKVGAVDKIQIAVVFNDITERKRNESRQRFLLKLADAIRPISDAREIEGIACCLLGNELKSDRAFYTEINEKEGYIKVMQDYLGGTSPSLAGTYPLSAYAWTIPLYQKAEPVIIPDIYNSELVAAADIGAMEATKVVSYCAVPLIKNNILVGALVVTEPAAREWKGYEVDLIAETAWRVWSAVEKAKTEEALRNSELKFRRLSESGIVSVAFFDLEGSIIEANNAFLNMFGFTRADLEAKKVRWDLYTPAEWMPRTLEAVEEFKKTGNISPYEKQYMNSAGELHWGIFAGATLEDGKTGVSLVVDITERKKAEESLRVNEERMRGLKEAYQSVVNGATLENSLSILSRLAINEVQGKVRTAFYLADENNTVLNTVRGAGNMPESYADEFDGFLIGLNSLACGLAISSGEPVITADVKGDVLWQPWLHIAEKYDYRACWSFPIKTKDAVSIGVFSLYFKDPAELNLKDRMLADTITQAAAVIITNHTANSQRTKAEEALRKSQDQLAEELNDAHLLEQLSSRIIEEGEPEPLYDAILDSAMDIMRAEIASLQVLDVEKYELSLLNWKGFHPGTVQYWQIIKKDSTTSCGQALAKGERVIISDIKDPLSKVSKKDMDIYSLSGIQSMQSTPLISRTGKILGMISTYWKNIHYPSEREISLFDMLVRQTSDLVERKLAADNLFETASRLHLALEAGKLGSYEFDFTTNKILASTQHKKNYGFAENEEMTIDQVYARIPTEDRERTEILFQSAIKKHEAYTAEYRVNLPTGDIRWIRAMGHMIYNPKGEVQKMTGISLDITEQKSFTEELTRQVGERTAELKRSNEELRQFAHVASHDLKEPVRKVKTFYHMLMNEFGDEFDGKARKYLERIGSAADRMMSMVEGVLHYSKLQSVEPFAEQVKLNEIIKQIETDLELVIKQKQAVINTNNALPEIMASNVLMYQLFYNLVLNSLKFSKPDEPTNIHISAQNLNLDGKDFHKIIFSDNGIGFEQEYGEDIFKTFTMLNPAKYEGTGLGLALCKRIVERYHGSIEAEGKLNQGAVFTIILPVVEPQYYY